MKEVRTKQQVLHKELHDMFRIIDQNGDGNLTTLEFREVVDSNDEISMRLHDLGVQGYELEPGSILAKLTQPMSQ